MIIWSIEVFQKIGGDLSTKKVILLIMGIQVQVLQENYAQKIITLSKYILRVL